ncbi:MAG: hypothetical protein EZS28_000496, partial [Streblomastix strix]
FFLPNGKEIIHKPIVIVSTMNGAALSNARSTLSTKLQGASHFLRLMPFNESELDVLAQAILEGKINNREKSTSIEKIMKAHKRAATIMEHETGTANERDSITLREILHFRMMRDTCPNFNTDQLIELVYSTQFNRKTAEQFLKDIDITQTKDDIIPLIRDGNLILSDSVKVPISTQSTNGPLDLPLTAEQRRVMRLIGAGVMTNRPVALFGESGAGKTHVVRTLAQTVGKHLGVIQFNADTDSSSIIGSLEIDGNEEFAKKLILRAKDITERAIDARHPLSIEFTAAALNDIPDISDVEIILRKISENSTLNDNEENQQDLNLIKSDSKQLITDIVEFQQQSARNFIFKEGILLRMMRQGGWVLLDGVESAPHEVERLMSLLEENPTLTIYEGVRPMIFHGRGARKDNQNNEGKNKLEKGKENDEEESIEITEGFQIFITCNDLKKLSPALRSRCFCIQMESAQEEVQLKELAESALSQSDVGRAYSIPISLILSKTFCHAREMSKNRKLLFSKDTFSPHRIVNSARGIGNYKITAKNIASGVVMSFIRCFKLDEDQKDISINSEEIVKKISKEKIAVSSNRWEEFIKQAGQFEYATVYQYIKEKGMKWLDDADELLRQLFSIYCKGKDRIKTLHLNDNIENFQIKDLLNILWRSVIEWLKEMKISDIRNTVSVLSEVDFVITSLYGIATPISQKFFRLHYLLEILQPAIELSDLNVGQGDILIQKSIKKDGFAGYKIEGKTPEDWMLIIARIQHTIQIFTSLPEIFPTIPVYLYILSTYMKNFFEQQIIKASSIKPTAIILVEHLYIRKILRYINLMSKEDESATVVGHLARSYLDINMYINNAPLQEKDNKTIQIILRKNQNPIIRFGEQEIQAQIAEVSQLIPTSQLQITPFLDLDLSSLTKQTNDEIFNMKEITSEQKLWILTDLFAEIPSDFLTQNKVLLELIQSIRQYKINAIQIGKEPFETSLLPLNAKLCEKAFEIALFMNNTDKQNPREFAEHLLQIHKPAENVLNYLASFDDSSNEIIKIFKDVGIDLWQDVAQFFIDIRIQVIELDEIGQMAEKQRILVNDFKSQIQNLENISKSTKFEKEAAIVVYFLRKINEPLRKADLQRLQNSTLQLNAFFQSVKRRKDIDSDSVKIPQIVDKYVWEPRYDNIITALLEYSVREEAISKTAEDASFDNIVSILALFKQDQSVDKIVNPFVYLLEQAKEGQKLKKDDITQLQSLSRIHLLCTAIFNDQHNTIKLSEVLQLLLRGDEHIVHVLQNSPHNVKFIQFPEFKPADLLSCIQFTTASGTFSGPLTQSSNYSPFNIKNFIPQNTQEALLKCAELLKGKDLKKKLEQKNISQWNALIPNDNSGQILRRLLRISEEIKQQQFYTEWLLDPDSDIKTLKRELCNNPGQGIAYQKNPAEYKQALVTKNEWENKKRLSVHYILLLAFANQSQTPKPQNQYHQTWEDKFHSMLLQLDRRNKPFGYRIANLLECNLIEDNEAQIARSVITIILHISNISRSILDDFGLDKLILISIQEYVERLFEDEKVPLETTPLIDLRTSLVCLVLKKFENVNKKVQIEQNQRNSRNRNFLITALQDLIVDIQMWILKYSTKQDAYTGTLSNPLQKMDKEETKKTQWIRDAGQKLIDKAQNNMHDALEVAKMIKLERSGIFYYKPPRLLCICEDDRLDGYFSEYECPAYKNLQDKCDKFIFQYSKLSSDSNQPNMKFYNEFKNQFPNIEKEIKQRGENSLFREKMLTELKIKQYPIALAQAISRFIPLFAPIDLERTKNLRIDPTITVRSEDQSIIGKDFNALIGGTGKDQIRFISSSITADFGIHIDRAQTSNCGNVTFDNLSSDDVTIELKNVEENKMKIKLASNSVNVGEKIYIQFYVVEQSSEEPSLASIIFKIVAKSKKNSNQTAICEIRAFVRRTPLCALIESSSSLMLNSATSCTLAPKKFTELINIIHHIPRVSLSSRAIGWSVNSNDTNVANKPLVTMNEEKHKMVIQFESDTTGTCAGQMTIGFGQTEFYKINLKVPVSRIPLIKIYHPANPKLTSISIIQSNFTHIVIQNNGDLEREIQLNSSEEEDIFEYNSFLLKQQSSKIIKVIFNQAEEHIISDGISKIIIRLVRTKLSFSQHQGNADIYIQEGVYFPCFKINVDGSSEFKYQNRQSFSNGQYPTIVTENDCMNKLLPMKAQQEYNSMKRWILDPKQGFISIKANVSVYPEACVLWAENGKNHQYFRIIDQTLDRDIKQADDKIEEANDFTGNKTAGIPKLLVDASNLFLTSKSKINQVDRDSVLKSAQKGAKEKNEGQIFSQIILALDNEVQRQTDKTIPEIITLICRQLTKREDWSTSIPAVPSTWTGIERENKIKGMHLIWGAITLLSTLRNPLTLTKHEIKIFRQKLLSESPTPEFDRKLHQNEDIEIEQETNGQEIDCVGIIYGRFTEAEAVQRLFDKIENIKPPEFPPLTGNQENNKPISIKDLLNKVQDKLDNSVNKFQTIKNPSELNQLLIQIPSITSQIIIAAQCAENQNISKLISNLGILTIICQELQKSKENMQLFYVQIQKSVQGCYRSWAQLIKAGVNPPNQLNISRDILNKIQSSGVSTHNVEVANIPECQLPHGVWHTQMDKTAHIAGVRVSSKIQIPKLQIALNEISQTDGISNINASSERPLESARQNLLPQIKLDVIQLNKKNNSTVDLSDEKMAIAIRDTFVEKPLQEELNEGEEFIPKQVNINEIQTQLIQVDITEILKGKKVEDLLIMEYEAVRRAPKGINNKKKVSEGRVVVPIDGTQDRHEANSIENRPEIIELHQLSLQIQSLLYAEIARYLKPFDQNKIIPYTLHDTEVSIMVDISSSMTKLSKMKQMGAMVLVSGISEILSSFGIQLHIFAFADREAIWKLSDSNHHNPQEDLIRLVDSLREGGRPGSCPLDAAITSHNEWAIRLNNNSQEIQVVPNHLTIIISDFISAQVLDRDRDWSTENTGRCILISLNTEFNQELLDTKNIPKELYENGIFPKFTPGNNISSLCIDPKELCSGFASTNTSKIPKILSEIASKIITKTDQKHPDKQKSTSLAICAPVQDKSMFWANITQSHEIKAKSNENEEKTKTDFFVQIKQTSNFALVALNTTLKKIFLKEPKNIETDNKWLQRQASNDNKIPFIGIARDVATTALTHYLVPNRAAGKEPSASSGQLWIPGLRRFIQSGFTYPYLFLKKSRRNQKAYSITFVIDNTQRIFSPLNILHTVSTIASLINSVTLIPDGDEIVVDVIAASDGKANLLIQNIQVNLLSDWTLISDILRTADKIAGTESGLGIGIASALQLTSRRSGVGFGRRIIAFTDSIISNASEVSTLRQGLIDCDASQIDVLGVGLGIAPLQLPLLFPNAVYAPNSADLGRAMAVALGVSGVQSSENIIPRQLFSITDKDQLKKLEGLLCGNPQMCTQLAQNIRERELSLDFFETFGDTDLLYMKGDAKGLKQNAEKDPYYNKSFEGFQILIVCLYLGANEGDKQKLFKQNIFDNQCGAVLRRKGFNYKFVCSYGEGLNELTRVENDRCPYTQLWLFSSEGYGELPKEALDKDTKKIIPFLQAVTDFWQNGGGLFLFCDNHPYNFEANYLLANHFIFTHGGRSGVSSIRLGGNYRGLNQIQVAPTEAASKGSFNPILHLNPPGSAKSRISLRPGLIHFSEGNTISFVVDEKDQPLTTAEQLWPFTPFAWTSENVDPPRPFILFFDPQIPPDSEAQYCSETCKEAKTSPGPIVLHGGFTSAFSEFGEDEKGMGRLVVSIACWLTRFEERVCASKIKGALLLTTSPALKKQHSHKTFTKWRIKPVVVKPRHSILILDGSGSMRGSYGQLIIASNQYISSQSQNGGIISVVSFSSSAKVLYERQNRQLGPTEGYDAGGTNFQAALQTAIPLAQRNTPQYECRILFFTDGYSETDATAECNQLATFGVRIDVVGFGKLSEKSLNSLVRCGGKVSIGKTMDDVVKIFVRIAATDDENQTK